MNKRESSVQKGIWAKLGFLSVLFRVNTGRAWLSGLGPRGVMRLDDGSVNVAAARPIALGFANPAGEPVNGTADLIGWTSIEITPEMVGQKIAVFTSVETKRTQGGRTSDAQQKWCDQVTKAGGIAFVANSENFAEDTLQKWVHHHAAKVWMEHAHRK
jgi:hypothetical protein